MVSLELYNECISILYIILLILESPYMKKDTKSDMYATFLFFPLLTACVELFIAVDTKTFLDGIIIKVALPWF